MLAVTGITGHSGRFFLEELISHRYQGKLRCLVRPSSDTSDLDSSGLDVEKVVGSLENTQVLRELTAGADTLLHITNIRWSLPLVQIALEQKVRRILLVHTTGVFSKHKMASAEYKDIEERLQKLVEGLDVEVCILRPTMIFGDLCDHNIHKFIRMVDKLPLMPEIDHGKGLLQPVNARDLGKGYYLAVTAERLHQREYILSGERALSMHQLFQEIGKDLGKRTRFISVPMEIGVFLARSLKAVTFGKADFVEKVLRMGENRSFSHETATRDLGYEPEPFSTGLEREVREYQAHQAAR